MSQADPPPPEYTYNNESQAKKSMSPNCIIWKKTQPDNHMYKQPS